MRTIIHVNQHNIKHNQKSDNKKPVLTVKDYKRNRKADSISIVVPGVGVVAKVVYQPDNPLNCGARCWVETEYEVVEHA